MSINYQHSIPQNGVQKKYCKFCGALIDYDCVVCPACGKQIELIQYTTGQPQVIINNQNMNTVQTYRNICNKWTAFFLCLFLGFFGAHKFYEGKTGMGILYLFTLGLFGLGWFIDLIVILTKTNPYYT